MANHTTILVDTGALLTQTFTSDETATDADGDVTVAAIALDGTDLAEGASTATLTEAGTGAYEWEIGPQAAPDVVSLAWSGEFDGVAHTLRSLLEIVGGYYFTVAELRASDGLPGTARPLSNTDTWPPETLRLARQAAETEAERILGYACVPRARVETLTVRGAGGYGVLVPSRAHVREVRAATLSSSGAELDVTSWVVEGEYGQRIRVPLANGTRVRVVYEHGLDDVPFDIGQACMARARHALERIATALPATTERYVVTDTGTFSVALPGVRSTGNAHIDAVYLPAAVRSL